MGMWNSGQFHFSRGHAVRTCAGSAEPTVLVGARRGATHAVAWLTAELLPVGEMQGRMLVALGNRDVFRIVGEGGCAVTVPGAS
mmetsp:Transcript_17434/g.41502  ORF Transcript_17434/g.41502 Transcript_17434/m.41502 type:complete len:84 (+) Transcript_17434:82-333(+)